ncbi:MAG: LacI family DNA-binding transcriptional regulator [Caldilineaceae bacterium]
MATSSKNGKVSIYTVAEAAGVSYGTVSRALNNRPDVNPATRQRVLETAQRLGYVPNPIARGLSTKATTAFGIIVPGLADPFFMPITQSIEQVARQLGYATLLRDTGRSAAAAVEGATVFAHFRVSGVIILGGSQQLDEALAQQLEGIPTVIVLRPALNQLLPAVYIDHAAGAKQVMEHLVATQRRRIAFVCGDNDSVAAHTRLQGYQAALQAHDLPLVEQWIVRGEFTIEGSAAATGQLLALPPAQRPDAIFYASDAMALAGLHRLHGAGVRIPNDIAVAGYGNIAFAAISEPPLTTVRVGKQQLGVRAVQMLQQMIARPTERPADVTVATELIVRASSFR